MFCPLPILPEPWVGMAAAEMVSLLAAQMWEQGLGCPDRAALAVSNRRIWAKLARANGNT